MERRASCAVACAAVVACHSTDPTKRKALDALVRYATPKGVQRPGDLRTPGVAALDGTVPPKGAIHHEHVVQVRVMVDHMMARRTDPLAVLDAAVVAHVLRSEHREIGPLVTRHAELYPLMKSAEVAQLRDLARGRYTSSGLELIQVPHVIDPADELSGESE